MSYRDEKDVRLYDIAFICRKFIVDQIHTYLYIEIMEYVLITIFPISFPRPKIKNALFPLYLPTPQNAPTQHILFAN
jgi:hypothetical protein